MSQIADIMTAGATALATVGSGIGFLIHRYDKRFERVEADLETCRKREAEANAEKMKLLAQVRETAAKHLTVIELLWQVAKRDRNSVDVLQRCERLLDKLKEETLDG